MDRNIEEDVAKMRQDLVDSTRAASHARLRLKKHDALVDLIKDVEPKLQDIWQRLEDEESITVGDDLKAASNFGIKQGKLGSRRLRNSDATTALFRSLSPMLDVQASRDRSPSLSTESISLRSGNNLIQARRSNRFPVASNSEIPQTPQGDEFTYINLVFEKHVDQVGDDSDSSGDPEEEIENRPRKLQRGDRKTQSPVPPRETSVASSSSMTMAEMSSSARPGLRARGRPSGSYNPKTYYQGVGLLPKPGRR
ncbi:hypothetical protein BJ170DRAFT_217113 [Xylariales sp. AK1849]|nr:hypothetical protein BJ170DRAFT_217113 [Xylariales sp. AK1849]